jgi:thioredoxin 1
LIQAKIYSIAEKKIICKNHNQATLKRYTPMSDIPVIAENDFQTTIKTGTVLVDFYADWCGPCRMLTPILEQLSKEMKSEVTVIKVNVDTAQNIAAQYDITSIPTIILFKDGVQKVKSVGLKDFQGLKTMIESV